MDQFWDRGLRIPTTKWTVRRNLLVRAGQIMRRFAGEIFINKLGLSSFCRARTHWTVPRVGQGARLQTIIRKFLSYEDRELLLERANQGYSFQPRLFCMHFQCSEEIRAKSAAAKVWWLLRLPIVSTEHTGSRMLMGNWVNTPLYWEGYWVRLLWLQFWQCSSSTQFCQYKFFLICDLNDGPFHHQSYLSVLPYFQSWTIWVRLTQIKIITLCML